MQDNTLPEKSGLMTLFTHPKIFIISLMGIASGLPLLLTGSTLAAWYTVAGVDIQTIGLLTLVGIPYTFKFLWSPLMDRYVVPFFGRRRGWILLTQALMVVSLVLMALFKPEKNPYLLGLIALLAAFISASQDIAIDAYRTDVLTKHERGMGASVFVLGYRVGMLVAGAFALVLSVRLGWQLTYFIMAGIMGVGMLVTLISPKATYQASNTPSTLKEAVVEPFIEFFTRHNLKAGLLLLATIIFYKFGDAFLLSLNTTFLLRGVHFSRDDLALVVKTFGLFSTIGGSLIAGILMYRWNLFKSLLVFGILQALANLTYMWLAMAGHHYPLFVFAIFSEYFCSGLGSTAFLALLMALCNHKYTATQFALLSAFSAIGRVYIGPVAGYLEPVLGWTWFFALSFIISLPGIGMLFFIRPYLKEKEAN